MSKPVNVELDQLVMALQDQSGSLVWMLDADNGELLVRSEDEWLDDDPEHEDEAGGRNLVAIEPLPAHVWYRHMVDFAAQCADSSQREELGRALEGKGAFRRFKDTLHQSYPELVPDWNGYRDQRAEQVARDWLAERGITPS